MATANPVYIYNTRIKASEKIEAYRDEEFQEPGHRQWYSYGVSSKLSKLPYKYKEENGWVEIEEIPDGCFW